MKNLLRLQDSQEDNVICGLVGVAGKIWPMQEKVFKQLLYVDGLRGMHSTGALVVPVIGDGDDNEVFRSGDMGPSSLLDWKDFKKAMSKVNKVLLGHNRFATVGKVNVDNAHPFIFKTLAGAHNGTLANKRDLPDSNDFEVDSQNLYHSIEKIGLEDTYDILRGAWALSWFDFKEDRLNFIRNKERPMSYCFSEDRRTIYWASEGGMLQFILNRCGAPHTEIIVTKVHHLYSFKIIGDGQPISDILIKDMTPKVIVLPKVTDIRKKSQNSSFASYTNKYHRLTVDFVLGEKRLNTYNQEYYSGNMYLAPYEPIILHVSTKCDEVTSKLFKGDILQGTCTNYNPMTKEYYISPHGLEIVEEEEEEAEEFEADLMGGFNGEQLTCEQFHNRISNCAWCHDPMFFEDIMTWVDSHEVICEGCTELDEVQEYLHNG